MRTFLFVLFTVVLVCMFAMTVVASLDRSVFNVGQEILSDRWFQATLLDAYLAFLTIYVWVAYKEASMAGRVIWFVLITDFGFDGDSELRTDPALAVATQSTCRRNFAANRKVSGSPSLDCHPEPRYEENESLVICQDALAKATDLPLPCPVFFFSAGGWGEAGLGMNWPLAFDFDPPIFAPDPCAGLATTGSLTVSFVALFSPAASNLSAAEFMQ